MRSKSNEPSPDFFINTAARNTGSIAESQATQADQQLPGTYAHLVSLCSNLFAHRRQRRGMYLPWVGEDGVD